MLVRALCWVLVFLARGLEWTRRGWEELWFRAIGERAYARRWVTEEGFRVGLWSRAFVVAVSPVQWLRRVAVWLVALANRGLPPIPDGRGFLARLYP